MSRSRFNFGNFTADRTIDKRVVNYPLWVQTEMTDSFQYLQQMVGITAKQAKMLRGFNASVISGFDSLAWAPCLGYGNLAAEVVLDLLLPGVPLAALYLEILAESDIIITPGYAPARQRGLVTHEYGHYALCAMADQLTGSIFQDVVLTWDTVLAGPGNPGPGDEARVINEAFADFFTGQVVGGYNYFTVAGANQGDVNISVAPLGLDRNLVARNSGGNVIGVFATLLQDVFDGHAKTFEGTVRRGTGPGSGDFWQVPDPDLPNEGPILWSNRTDGDLDPERVRLPGQDIAKFTRIFFDERNILGAYRYDAFERAVERVMRERGETWCQRCLVMAPHFVTGFEGEFETVGDERVLDLDQKVREILESCVANSRLAELLGPPPRPLDSMDGHDCVLCPSTHGMGADGRCTECVADVQLDWGSLAASGAECLQHEVPWSSATGDNCPSQLVVEVTGARDGVRLSTVTPSATPAPADQGACESSVLRGLISQADEYPPVALEPRTFHVPGLWSNAPLLRGCHVGGTDGHPVDGEVDGEYVRVSADAGELNASLTLRSYCPPVIVR